MKLTRNQLKEVIRGVVKEITYGEMLAKKGKKLKISGWPPTVKVVSINDEEPTKQVDEIDFKDQASFDAYNKKHKMRKSTKVKIAGKDTTAGDASGKSKKKPSLGTSIASKVQKQKDKFAKAKKDDLKRPAVAKSAEKEKEMSGYEKAEDSRATALKAIEKGVVNKSTMQDTFNLIADYAEWNGYEDELEDFKNDLPDIIDDEDIDTFESYAEELLDPDKKEKDMGKTLAQMDYDDEDSPESYYDDEEDTGGPSYANVPKGAKSSEHAKLMKKNDALADEYGYSDSNDLMGGAHSEEVEEFIDEIGADVDWGVVQSYLDDIRDYEQGMEEDDFKSEHAREKIQKIVNKAVESKPPKKEKTGKEVGKEMDKAVDDANAKLDKAELDQAYKEWDKHKQEYLDFDYHPIHDKGDKKKKKEYERLKKKNKDYYNNVVKPLEKKVYPKNESVYRFRGKLITESSRPKRSTVKEIAKWIKGLEENRYKKISGADSRRVAWFVNNNLAEDFEQMPKSIVKKWSKAQYGRERYLAREFMRYRKGEQKLRESIRGIINNLITEVKRIKYKKNDWKKYNQLVKKGKSVMVQTAFGDQFAWEDGSNYGVFASEESGREIELSHNDIDMVEIF